jgi:3-deoxy-manno-octulosonate cytidylyltransferase (CMP-KDO synthetase)
MYTAVGIIPARYGSSRLPAKALATIAGKPMIQLVYESAAAAGSLDRVIVATDDRRILDAVTGFGGSAVMTSPDCRSGSDRIAEAASGIDCAIVVNVQGDEPLIHGEAIDALVEALVKTPSCAAATVATPLANAQDAADPNVVKVVRDIQGNALYFSRARIPYAGGGEGRYLKHIGLYAYRKEFLLRFTGWPETELERMEKLEQLRILEHGTNILVIETPHDSIGVDTPEDLERVRKMLKEKKSF